MHARLRVEHSNAPFDAYASRMFGYPDEATAFPRPRKCPSLRICTSKCNEFRRELGRVLAQQSAATWATELGNWDALVEPGARRLFGNRWGRYGF